MHHRQSLDFESLGTVPRKKVEKKKKFKKTLIQNTPKKDDVFEELIYEILQAEGFKELRWHGRSADGGKDVSAEYSLTNPAGGVETQKWHCDAKIYAKGIPWDKIAPTIHHTVSNSPDYLLLAVHPQLSNDCWEELRSYRAKHPFPRIEVWEGKKIEELVYKHPHILKKFFPSVWSEAYEADVYLREVQTVLEKLYNEAQPIWKGPEKLPMSDLLRLHAKTHPSIEVYDQTTRLSPLERKVMQTSLLVADRLQKFLCKSLNLSEFTVLVPAHWDGHPEVKIIIPLLHTVVIGEDIKGALNQIIVKLTPAMLAHLQEAGVMATASRWQPWAEENHVRAYLFFQDQKSG